MVLDERIVLVAASCASGRYSVCTGHLVTEHLVLTATHVLNGATTAQVRSPKVAGYHPVTVVWSSPESDLDVTLLKLDETPWPALGPVRWGRYSREDNVRARCAGFPAATRVNTRTRDLVRETADVGGTLTAGGGKHQELLELLPEAAPNRIEDWQGLSGAAVLCEGHVVGVVRSGPPCAGGQRLWVLPVERLLSDPTFAEWVGRPVAQVVPTLSGLVDVFGPLPKAPSPAHLLDSRHRVVPFNWGVRCAAEALLQRWCADSATTSATLLTGAGGAGKTRLLGEWCIRMHAQGWRVGFVSEGATRDDLRAMTQGVRPTLLVLDYAERRPDLALHLGTLTAISEVPKLRIALLARTPGDWWSLLQQQAEGPVRDLLTVVLPYQLTPVQLAGEARQEMYDAATAAFARHRRTDGAGHRGLADGRYGSPMYLHLAALADVDGLELEAPQLLDGVVAHEERFWGRRFQARFDDTYDLHDFVQQARHGVAALTLRGGSSSRTEGEMVLMGAGGVPQAHAGTFWRFLRDLQPAGTNGVRGLEPDILGEALVTRVLRCTESPQAYLRHALQQANETALQQAFTVLGGIELSGESRAGEWLEAVLSADLKQRAVPAFHAILSLSSRSAFSTLGDRLATAMQQHGTARHALKMEPSLPRDSVALRQLSVWVIRTRLEALCEDDDIERARLLNNLGNALAGLGQREQALLAVQEATGLQRQREAAFPDTLFAILPMSLHNLAIHLHGLGRREEALVAVREATELFRQLATGRPSAFLIHLGTSLNTLGSRLSELGRREEALAAVREAMELFRKQTSPQTDAYQLDLARVLRNLATMLGELGQREEALTAALEAMELYRRLAATQPDALLPDLAGGLNSLASMLSGLGRREEALAAGREAIELYRQLAVARPDSFLPPLATSLNNLAKAWGEVGRREDALACVQEATSLLRRLATRLDAIRPDLAMSLNNLGIELNEAGRMEDALAVGHEATALYRQLATTWPDKYLPDVAMSLINSGNALRTLGRNKESLAAAREATDLYRQLANARPDAFLPDLAASIANLSNTLCAIGELKATLAAAQEATPIYRRLAEDRPDAFLPNLAASLVNLGNALSAIGSLREALTAAEEASNLYQELAATHPDAFRPNLAASLNSVSIILSKLDRPLEALDFAAEATNHYRGLVSSRPGTFNPKLASSLNSLGNALSELGRREKALAAAEEATELYRQLAAAHPDAFLPDLAMSLSSLGNRLSEVGRQDEALSAAKEATRIDRHLATESPEASLPGLAMSLNNLGNILSKLNRWEEALTAAEEAIATLSPQFMRHPGAFAASMRVLATNYEVRCETHRREPNSGLLAPILQALHTLDART